MTLNPNDPSERSPEDENPSESNGLQGRNDDAADNEEESSDPADGAGGPFDSRPAQPGTSSDPSDGSRSQPNGTEDEFLSRNMNYLGELGAKLRDLQGFRTLAHELMQNADDAGDATSMSFHLNDDALVVDNNGVFSDCGRVNEIECPWKQEKNGHRCDFHRFRNIAAGDKRGEAGTTGAFGIGFITVYQITDNPEIISNGRHWVLQENQVENKRIRVCKDAKCQKCQTTEKLPGTRLRLPWAKSDSPLRRDLQVQTVTDTAPSELRQDLQTLLPTAMLFLKRLRRISISHNNGLVQSLQREEADGTLVISDSAGQKKRAWHLIEGDFSEQAKQLRAKHGNKIENKKSSEITIAIPISDFPNSGLLCACLPTEQSVGLPLHINADFFPTSDRKRIILEGDYQSEWNRAAIVCAMQTITAALPQLTGVLTPERVWSLIKSLKDVSDHATSKQIDEAFGKGWPVIVELLKTEPLVFTSLQRWEPVSAVYLLKQVEENEVTHILEALGIKWDPLESTCRHASLSIL